MTYELLSVLAVFAFLGSVTPGPNNLMLMASAANFGARRTLPHLLGIVIGFAVMVLLTGMGLMQLFNALPVSYLILKTASVMFLLFLAWKIASAQPLQNEGAQTDKGTPLTFTQAALFQWVNPKAWAMALTGVSVYSAPAHPVLSVVVALVFTVVNLISQTAWIALGTQLRRLFGSPLKMRVFNIVTALLLVGSLYPVLFMQ